MHRIALCLLCVLTLLLPLLRFFHPTNFPSKIFFETFLVFLKTFSVSLWSGTEEETREIVAHEKRTRKSKKEIKKKSCFWIVWIVRAFVDTQSRLTSIMVQLKIQTNFGKLKFVLSTPSLSDCLLDTNSLFSNGLAVKGTTKCVSLKTMQVD